MKKRKVLDNIFLVVMLIYFLILLGVLLRGFQPRFEERSISIVPFKEIYKYFITNDSKNYMFTIYNILGNIILFIPMGIYFYLLNKRKSFFKNTLIICLVSIGIETLQYIFRVGIFDIDDIILNTFGGAVGYLISIGLIKVFETQKKFKDTIAILSLLCLIILLAIMFYFNVISYN